MLYRWFYFQIRGVGVYLIMGIIQLNRQKITKKFMTVH